MNSFIGAKSDSLNQNVHNFGTQNNYGIVNYGTLTVIISKATADKEAAPPQIVFFSYARADDGANYDDPKQLLLRRLTNNLTDAGFAVCWDRVSLPSRSLPFSKEIGEAIRGCDRVVLVAGPGAAASKYVQAELRCALDFCKPITVPLPRVWGAGAGGHDRSGVADRAVGRRRHKRR